MLVNISLSLLLMNYIGAYGIPFAYSCASLTGAVILIVVLNKKVGGFLDSTLSIVLKSLVASLIMSAVVIGISKIFGIYLEDSLISRIIKLFVPTGCGIAVYGLLLYVFKVEQIKDFVSSFVSKFRANKKEG